MSAFFAIVSLVMALVVIAMWRWHVGLRREAFIRDYALPMGLFDQFRKHHPDLSLKDCQLVANGLRQFFLAYLKSGRKYVSMPSQVADDLWHEFILFTRNYDAFCRQAFGRFLHHTPAVALAGGARQSNAGLRRCWWYACKADNINPRKPTRLPLLFALDAKLNVVNGFRYMAECGIARLASTTSAGAIHCGGDFASTSYDGSTDGFGDSSSGDSSGSDSSSSGSDGGGGCGGGGCGGGE